MKLFPKTWVYLVRSTMCSTLRCAWCNVQRTEAFQRQQLSSGGSLGNWRCKQTPLIWTIMKYSAWVIQTFKWTHNIIFVLLLSKSSSSKTCSRKDLILSIPSLPALVHPLSGEILSCPEQGHAVGQQWVKSERKIKISHTPVVHLWEGGEHEAVTTRMPMAFRLLKALYLFWELKKSGNLEQIMGVFLFCFVLSYWVNY